MDNWFGLAQLINMRLSKKVKQFLIIVLALIGVWYIVPGGLTQFSGTSHKLRNTTIIVDERDTQMAKRVQTIRKLCSRPDVVDVFLQHTLPEIVTRWEFYNSTGICTCKVPKAASTLIGRFLLMAHYPKRMHYLQNMPSVEVHSEKLTRDLSSEVCTKNAPMSFFVTRDPYSRLFSAYIDKVFMGKFVSIPRELFYTHNGHLYNSDLCYVYNASFEQFLEYIVTRRKLDYHFAPISLMCNPCKNNYSVIIRQESFRNDFRYLLHKLKLDTEPKKYLVDYFDTDFREDTGIEDITMSLFGLYRHKRRENECMFHLSTYNDIIERFWNALKFLGHIDTEIPVPYHIFFENDDTPATPEKIFMRLLEKRIPQLNSRDRRKQRHQFLAQAYEMVGIKTIAKIQKVFRFDFILFNYDILPPRLGG